MTLNQINHLNTGLMMASVAIAAVVPFELFLFAYAILGPAHYLTQISWLHDRNYFTTGRWDFVFLLLLTVPLALRFFLRSGRVCRARVGWTVRRQCPRGGGRGGLAATTLPQDHSRCHGPDLRHHRLSC